MNKTFFLLTIITLSLTQTFARDISEKKNLVGLLGGITFNTMGLQKDATYDNTKNTIKPGGIFGINFEHRFKKVFALEIGANYINKGTQQKIQDDALNRSFFRLNFHSIEVPVIAKFYIGKKKIFNLNVGGYASYAFNIQSRTKLDFKDDAITDVNDRSNNLLKNNNNKDINGNRPYRAYDAGVNVGFEFVSKSGFGAGARVQQGFIDFTNSKYILPFDNKKVFHTNILAYALFKI